MTAIDRRALLAGAALAMSAGFGPARAEVPPSGRQAAGFYRYKIGDYEMTAINDGTWFRPIDDKFVKNAPHAAVQQALADSFQPTDGLPTPFTTLAVNTGSKLILIDTGTGGQLKPVAPQSGTWEANLAAAGIDPKAVDIILISHFHADHINGLKTKDGQFVFPNAEISVSAPEWTYWMDDANMSRAAESLRPYFLNARRIFADIAKDVRRFTPGGEVAPGVTAIASYGHTPGHTSFAIASGGEAMLALGDVAQYPQVFVRHPEWQPAFDTDGALAVETRKKMLDRLAANKMLVQGYHFPFPAVGHIVRTAAGYDFVPVLWQATL